MATFVLVHGAWQGASTWEWVMPELEEAGHRVYLPTLTGLGAHAHQLSPEVNLETHIRPATIVTSKCRKSSANCF